MSLVPEAWLNSNRTAGFWWDKLNKISTFRNLQLNQQFFKFPDHPLCVPMWKRLRNAAHFPVLTAEDSSKKTTLWWDALGRSLCLTRRELCESSVNWTRRAQGPLLYCRREGKGKRPRGLDYFTGRPWSPATLPVNSWSKPRCNAANSTVPHCEAWPFKNACSLLALYL